MFTWFHKLISTIYLNAPSVHYIAPKALNVYFKNAINPTYKMLHLQNRDVQIDIMREVEEQVNVFNLVLKFKERDKDTGQGYTDVEHIAKFATEKEAKNAAIILRNKLFSVEKSLVKALFIFVALLYVLAFLTTLIPVRQEPAAQPGQMATNPVAPQLPPGMSQEEFQKMQQELLNQISQPQPAQPQAIEQPVATPESPAVEGLLNGLGK